LRLHKIITFATVLRLHRLFHSNAYTPGADKLGIISAVICAVHCLVIPALFLLKYSFADSLTVLHSGEGGALPVWWHVLDYVFLIIGFVAVLHASTHSASAGVRVALWLFWLCLGVAVIFEDSLHWLSYIASAGLIGTHFVNIRQHSRVRMVSPADIPEQIQDIT